MKNILVLFLLLIAFPSMGQRLTANDMIANASCKSFQCFNGFILTKHYSFHLSSTKDGNEMGYKNQVFDYYSFLSDAVTYSSGDIQARNGARILLSKNKKITVIGVATSDLEYYSKLFADYTTLGFVETSTTNKIGSVTTVYKSKKHPSMFLLVNVTKKDVPEYGFELHKNS